MDITQLIIQIVLGAIGGNAAGAVLKDKSLGTAGNSIAGVIGGIVGGQILSRIFGSAGAEAAASMDWGVIVQQVLGGGIGGAVVMIAVGVIKGMNKA